MKKERLFSLWIGTKTLFNIIKCFLVFSLCLIINTNIPAQNQRQNSQEKISLEAQNLSLSEILKKIEDISDYKINFNYDDINPYKASVKIKNKSVKEALDIVLYNIVGQPFEYNISGTFITIKKKSNAAFFDAKGHVSDDQGEPLPGVNIKIKGTFVGSNSDIDGNFSVPIPKGIENPILIFTYVGMEKKEVPYAGEYLNVRLNNGVVLSDIVVTGIFNKAKESYTGAATSITSKELQEAGNRSIITSIRNIDPSFVIADNINLGSDPNKLPAITLRGTTTLTSDVRSLKSDNSNLNEANQPLFILDGFEISLTRMMDMDENQIENITILKDASATAMYGTRGANGVIVITSQKPKPGKLRVTYKGGVNIEAPDLSSYNLLDAKEKLEFEKAAGLYSTNSASSEQNLLDLYNQRKTDVERGVDTYWLKYPVRTGVGSKHSLRFEGGEETFQYAASVSYNNINGVMKGSGRNVFNGNMFFSYQLNKLRFQNDLQISSTKTKNSPYGNFDTYGKINSYWTPYDADGNIIKVLENYTYASNQSTNIVYNPLYNALVPSKDESNYSQIQNNFSVEYQIIPKELIARARLSVTKQNNRSDYYLPANHTNFDSYTEDDYNRKGLYTYDTGEFFSYEGDLTLQYNKTVNTHHLITLGASYNIYEAKSEDYSVTGEGISILNMDFLGMASQYAKDGRPLGSESISRRLGTTFNGNYIFDRRYFADLSAKIEGSSRFGSEKRFAPFWSSGIGWNLHNESFMKDNTTLNIARLRLSYGTSGNQSFSPYQSLTTYKNYMGKGYNGWYGVYVMGLGNPDLGWQTTRQLNIGTEVELFKGRIRLNVDVYDKVTDNLLSDIDLPSASGFKKYKANIGKVSNKGLEATLNVYLIRDRERDFTWSVGGSLAHNKNKIEEISNSLSSLNEQILSSASVDPSYLYKEGKSTNTMYAVRSKGIDPSNGMEIYIKADGTETYTWDAKDQVAVGNTDPKIQGNLNTTVRYKGISLNVILGYRRGGQLYNSTLVSKVENINPYDNADKRVLYDRWKVPGDVTFFKSVLDRSKTYATSRFVMDNNILECRKISLEYQFPPIWTKKYLSMQYLSIAGYIEDAFRISSIKQERGLSYPYSRKFSVSLTARF